MKLTKQKEAAISEAYETFWISLLGAKIELYSAALDDNYRLIGTTENEVFFNRQEAVSFLKETSEQVGNIERRNSKIKMEAIDNLILITDQFDAYVFIENDWAFYGKTRVSTWMQQHAGDWKLIQQHFSFPDSKAEEGQTIGLEKISKENLELKEAIKRRTIELENKNRELEIETALERVRARTIAMQRSDELAEASFLLDNQVRALGIKTRGCAFNIYGEHESTEWFSSEAGTMPTYKTPRENVFLRYYEAGRAGEAIHIETFEGDACVTHYDYLCTLPVAGESLKKFKENGGSFPTQQIDHVAYFKYGYLLFITLEPVPEAHEIFKRFAKVFEQTYTRFLDLQKAEAQAREAKIEAALERTRTQSMIMQHSNELDDSLRVFHEQVLLLGIPSAFSFLWLPDEKNDRHIFWAAWKENMPTGQAGDSTNFKSKAINYPLDRNEPATAQCLIDWKSNEPVYSYHVPPPAVENYFAVWQELIDGVEHLKPEYFSGGLYYVEAFMKYGCFGVMVTTDLTEDERKLLNRFAIEFERTYTRFLDLQKAEAQARESQIQLALERVRARTMAMLHSDELQDAAILLFTQMKALGIHTGSCGFNIWDNKEKTTTVWMSSAEGGLQAPFKMPHAESVIYQQVLEAMKRGEDFLVKEVGGNTLEKHFDYLLTLPGIGDVIKQLRETGYEFPETMVYHFAFFNNGYLSFHLHEHHPETHDIFKRFAKVFEQTYTRFLDLQKAEAQTREAKIETALEKVRSRSLAMHKSDELNEVVVVLFEKLKELQIPVTAVGIGVYIDGSKDMNTFVCGENKDGLVINNYRLPYFHHTIWEDFNTARKKQLAFFTGNYSKEEKNSFYEYLFEHVATLRHLPDDIKRMIFESPAYTISMLAVNNALFNINDFEGKNLSENEVDIIKRFAKVFDQAYTRFLDLQKAEAQSREAQIELGLERVRARAMAMQKSDELSELVDTVFKELTKLDFALNWCIINIIDEPSLKNKVWAANPETNKPPESYLMKFEDYPFHHSMMRGYQERKSKHVYVLEGKEKETYDDYLFNKTEWRRVPKAAQAASRAMKRYVATFTFSNFGGLQTVGEEYLSEENLDILSRFGKVFDLTYTRFNDLQKAEAQAREAQIEAALERVRSRSMGMQKSEELKEVIKIVYQQLTHLKIKLDHAGFVVDYAPKGDWHFWIADEQDIPSKITHPYFESVWANQFNEAKEKGTDIFATKLNFEEKNKFYNELLSYVPGLPQASKDFYLSCPGLAASTVLLENVGLYIENFSGITYTDEENNTLMRFGKVFQQTYTRFLDLQKAEAQAREAQIEAALERVRARTMAMQKSTDLGETSTLLFGQLKTLVPEVWTSGFVLCDRNKTKDEWWLSGGSGFMPDLILPNVGDPLHNNIYKAWLNGESYYEEVIEGEPLQRHYEWLMTIPSAIAAFDAQEAAGIKQPIWQQLSCAYFSKGYLVVITEKPCGEAPIFKRFAQVFEQTYTRFLDLQKAEAQTRAAQIELAVERVRARALAMHNSTQILDVVATLRNEMLGLEIPGVVAATIYLQQEDGYIRMWDLSSVIEMEDGFHVSLDVKFKLEETDPGFYVRKVWNNNENYFVEKQEEKDMAITIEWLRQYYPEQADEVQQFINTNPWKYLLHPTIQLAHGKLSVDIMDTQPPAEMESIMLKMGAAFDLAYKRFLDLQKSEAQMREAQIELALERVRARTMAMQHSEELGETATILFEQFEALGDVPERVAIEIVNEKEHVFEIWATQHGGKQLDLLLKCSLDEPHVMQKMYKAWKEQKKSITIDLQGTELEEYFTFLKNAGLPVQREIFGKRRVQNVATFSKGILTIITPEPRPKETIQLLERFAAVFDGTYTRFLDLQKAEEQTRESQVQLAMERVRARTMAMQHSNELPDAANILFQQMESLGMPAWSAGYCIWDDDKNGITLWMSSAGIIQQPFHAPLTEDPAFIHFYEAYQRGETFYVEEMGGEELVSHYKYMCRLPVVGDMLNKFVDEGGSLPVFQIFHLSFFSHGFLLFITYEPVPDAHDIFKRFGKVFEQTYTRFLDLQKAEAQARESQIEAALERVRSRTLAMQKSDELAETAAVLFQQLIALGIEPNRLYISIIKSETGNTEFWITDEDGSKVSTAFAANMNDNATFLKMFEGWKQQQKSMVIDMQGEELQNYFSHLTRLGVPFKQGLTQKRRVQDIAYFSKGFIGMASPEEQPAATLALLERFAAVFNLTFTRFNDLKIAEAHAQQAEQDLIAIKEAKQKAEDALTELQVTQKQLIQSEKMASLGELTAGIAHEIQNPLNFVNNFSEVSNELIEELRAERLKQAGERDTQLEEELLADISLNLEKINHHGKRADEIVKGMLQHSRTSSAIKEPTNINKLADEYLRLAYHGLRAKDKSFNATLNTDYDETIENVNIIPQDIGRVILNLIMNAFYAISEKKKQNISGYEPTVTVSTKKLADKIQLSIKDDGNGIPQKILDKIFQPFFTTKPTGQGTGLGLSLSYDIVKAHGGEIKVNTKDGEGSEFIIHLGTI